MFDSGELRLVFLRLIADRPRHGYDLITAIEERTGGAYAPSPGVVYPTLTLLEDMEMIAEQDASGTRRLFAVTPAGEAHLAERADEVAALMARLDELGTDRVRSARGSIRRSMSNLREALRNRLDDENADEDLLGRIVEMVDDLARRIERLD